MRSLLPRAVIVLAAAMLLTGCAPGAGTTGDSAADTDQRSVGAAADTDTGSAGAAASDCSNVMTAGWELFVDPRLTVEPELDVYPLEAGDSIAFTDTPPDDEYTTYSYSTAYIDDGTAFPNRSAIFVGAENTGTWSLDGPFAVHSVDGGPYFGILQIEATTTAGTTEIARLCIAFAESE